MTTIQGPAVFLAQFIGDKAPFNSLDGICQWAADLGFKGIQMPTLDARFIDLQKAAESKTYADELTGKVASYGLQISELSTHLQGQLVAVHPAYDDFFDGFAPAALRGNPKARQEWAVQQMKYAAKASQNLGLNAHATFSGSLLWQYFHPWPQRPPGLIEEGFAELAKRWLPILNEFDQNGVDVCYEIHPGEDLFDGETYEIVGLIIKKAHAIYYWREYTLMSKSGKVKYLSETDGHWILLEEVPESYDVSRKYKKLTHKEISYNLYEYTDAFIARIYGFYEFEISGRPVKMVEYINPPFIISIEEFDNDDTTYLGKHISSSEVKKIFNVTQLPSKSGVGLVQPFLFNIYNTLLVFISFAILILATYIFFNMGRTEKNVLYTSLNFDEYKNM